MSQPEVLCPNCDEMVPGLYSGEAEVLHCGCFYEGNPGEVCWHVSTMCGPENRSDWDP